jgi:hypothetical protein
MSEFKIMFIFSVCFLYASIFQCILFSSFHVGLFNEKDYVIIIMSYYELIIYLFLFIKRIWIHVML